MFTGAGTGLPATGSRLSIWLKAAYSSLRLGRAFNPSSPSKPQCEIHSTCKGQLADIAGDNALQCCQVLLITWSRCSFDPKFLTELKALLLSLSSRNKGILCTVAQGYTRLCDRARPTLRSTVSWWCVSPRQDYSVMSPSSQQRRPGR